MKKKLLMLVLSSSFIAQSQAMEVFDPIVNNSIWTVNGSINTQTSVLEANHMALQILLREIGSTLSSRASQTTAMVEATGKNQIAFEKNMYQKLEELKNKNSIALQGKKNNPTNTNLPICSESASVGANDVSNGASISQSKISPQGSNGSNISNELMKSAIDSPPSYSENDANLTAVISAQYCDPLSYEAYGDTDLCKSVNQDMPGADIRLSSILTGARPDGTAPDKTFTQSQVEAAQMYVKNTARPVIAPMLQKGQVKSAQGAEYLGAFNQFRAITNAAAEPMESAIANRMAIEETKPLISEIKNSVSASSYFDKTASPEAKRTQSMSKNEFEEFEVGRRYSNLEYVKDLQAMEEPNLTREQIRISALQTRLMLDMKQQQEKTNILVGQLLASQARQEYEPKLSEIYSKVSATMGGG